MNELTITASKLESFIEKIKTSGLVGEGFELKSFSDRVSFGMGGGKCIMWNRFGKAFSVDENNLSYFLRLNEEDQYVISSGWNFKRESIYDFKP